MPLSGRSPRRRGGAPPHGRRRSCRRPSETASRRQRCPSRPCRTRPRWRRFVRTSRASGGRGPRRTLPSAAARPSWCGRPRRPRPPRGAAGVEPSRSQRQGQTQRLIEGARSPGDLRSAPSVSPYAAHTAASTADATAEYPRPSASGNATSYSAYASRTVSARPSPATDSAVERRLRPSSGTGAPSAATVTAPSTSARPAIPR